MSAPPPGHTAAPSRLPPELRGLSTEQFVELAFGREGYFAKAFTAYEPREGQVTLSKAVGRALESSGSLMAEGPTGTGKSFAYLVPATFMAVRHEDDQVVVAAPTIALQEQLVKKDLPALRKILPYDFTFALLKGKSNFLCRKRWGEFVEKWDEGDGEGQLFEGTRPTRTPGDLTIDQWATFRRWAEKTTTGDKSELLFEPPAALWQDVCGSSEECTACPKQCLVRQHKDAAKSADVIVTNYHVLLTHLALKRELGANVVLPQLQLVVLDESHELATVARKFFGFELRASAVFRMARVLKKEEATEDLGSVLEGLWETLLHDLNRYCVDQRNGNMHRTWVEEATSLLGVLRKIVDHWDAETSAAKRRLLDLAEVPDEEPMKKAARRHAKACERHYSRAEKTMVNLVWFVGLQADPETHSPMAYWLEGYDNPEKARDFSVAKLTLSAQPIDVSRYLKDSLYAEARSVIMTSATLATGKGDFRFVREETGFEGEGLQVPSPFDYAKQAMLVVPDKHEMPVAPGDNAFVEHAAKLTRKIVDHAQGRTLMLYTSWRNLRGVREKLTPGFPYTLLSQGNGPVHELVRKFKEETSSCLMGVASLWTGLDVPGEALVCVVVDKLPFPPKDDPIMDWLERNQGMDWAFAKYMLPKALIALRQGVGRLIRSKTDYGVVVLLDKRIHTARYKAELFSSLPNFGTVWTTISKIPEFLARAQAELAPPSTVPSAGDPGVVAAMVEAQGGWEAVAAAAEAGPACPDCGVPMVASATFGGQLVCDNCLPF